MKRLLLACLALAVATPAATQFGQPSQPTAPPTVLARSPIYTDDGSKGYAAGQTIYDSASKQSWTAASVAPGAAVWVPSQRRARMIVGNRNMVMYGASTAGTNQVQSTLTYRTGGQQACNITLRYLGWYVSQGNVDTPNASALTVKAGLTYGGTTYPLTVAAVRSFTVPTANAFVETDPLGICIPANTQFQVATLADGGSGNSYVYGIPASTALGDKYENGSALTDKVDSPSTVGTSGYYLTYGPSMILADNRAYAPNPILVTDSRGWGGVTGTGGGDVSAASGGDANGCFGYIQRALCRDGIGYMLIGRSSTKPSQWTTFANIQRRLTLVRDVGTVVLNELGINDVTNSVPAAMIAGYLGTINGYFAPLRVIQDTIQPRSSTTDNCATLANQTLPAYESIRTTLNGIIRAGTISGQSGYREASTAFEVNAAGTLTIDGGYYAPGNSDDTCLHLNATGAAGEAAATSNGPLQ